MRDIPRWLYSHIEIITELTHSLMLNLPRNSSAYYSVSDLLLHVLTTYMEFLHSSHNHTHTHTHTHTEHYLLHTNTYPSSQSHTQQHISKYPFHTHTHTHTQHSRLRSKVIAAITNQHLIQLLYTVHTHNFLPMETCLDTQHVVCMVSMQLGCICREPLTYNST